MKNRGGSLWIGGLAVLALLAADQFTKYLARTYLAGSAGLTVIPGVFELYYLENRGAAFGMLANHPAFFVSIALVILLLIAYVYPRLPEQRHFTALRLVCVMIAAGAAGNMLDRLIFGHVIDFLYVSLIDFPVFNFADCLICLGAAGGAILLLTVYKDDEELLIRKH